MLNVAAELLLHDRKFQVEIIPQGSRVLAVLKAFGTVPIAPAAILDITCIF